LNVYTRDFSVSTMRVYEGHLGKELRSYIRQAAGGYETQACNIIPLYMPLLNSTQIY